MTVPGQSRELDHQAITSGFLPPQHNYWCPKDARIFTKHDLPQRLLANVAFPTPGPFTASSWTTMRMRSSQPLKILPAASEPSSQRATFDCGLGVGRGTVAGVSTIGGSTA
jgi:hypothetical protein